MGWVRCALLRFEIHHGSEQMNTDEHGWMTTSVFIRHIRVDPCSPPAHQTGSRGGAERRSAGLARSAPRALRHDTPCPNTRRQKRALRATRQTPTIPDKTHQHHPCSSVVSVSIRGLFRRVTISAPTRVLFLAHVTRQGAFHRPLRASGRPNSPFSPCGRRGSGG